MDRGTSATIQYSPLSAFALSCQGREVTCNRITAEKTNGITAMMSSPPSSSSLSSSSSPKAKTIATPEAASGDSLEDDIDDFSTTFGQISVSQKNPEEKSPILKVEETDFTMSFSRMSVSQENRNKSPVLDNETANRHNFSASSPPDMSKSKVIRRSKDGIRTKHDVDSIIIVSTKLSALDIVNRITIKMTRERSFPTKNIKMTKTCHSLSEHEGYLA